MNATSSRSFPSFPLASPADDATLPTQKSRSNVLPQSFVADDRFREWFPKAFSRWLQSHFANPEMVSAVFGVRYQTALNWWNGANRASGDTVALVFLSYPAAVSWFLSEWGDDR